MKVLHISSSNRGGGGIAAVRLHEALLQMGVDSKLLTLTWQGPEIPRHFLYRSIDVARWPFLAKASMLVDRVLRRFKLKTDYYRKYKAEHLEGKPPGYDLFSFPISEHQLEKHPLIQEADVVHLHWVGGGFMNFTRFFSRLSKKIIWTLHDMNAFTGGCHHADDCLGYIKECDHCPQMIGTLDPAIAQKTLASKMGALRAFQGELLITAPSQWLLNCSKQSMLFGGLDHHQVYNVCNDQSFHLVERKSCRRHFSLPEDKKIILCVAHIVGNSRKGNRILIESLDRMKTKNILLCTVGSEVDEWKDNPSIVQLGYISDSEVMNNVYNAADVFALPSMAENFPNTIIESLLCGTPVVAFDVGGVSEQIKDNNGILVKERNSDAMAEGLDHYFENEEAYNREQIAAESKARYGAKRTVESYLNLYEAVMSDGGTMRNVSL